MASRAVGSPSSRRRLPSNAQGGPWPSSLRVAWVVFLAFIGIAAVLSPVILGATR